MFASRGLETTARSLATFAPADADAWRTEFAYWQRVRDDVLDAILRPFPPVRAGARLVGALGPGELLRLVRMLTLPARAYGEDGSPGDGARVLSPATRAHRPRPGQRGRHGVRLACSPCSVRTSASRCRRAARAG